MKSPIVFCLAIQIFSCVTPSLAHPGEEHKEHVQAIKNRAAMNANRRALDSCRDSIRRRGVNDPATARLKAKAMKLREDRHLEKLKSLVRRDGVDAASVLKNNHNKTSAYPNISKNTPEGTYFNNKSCVLVPEVTEGPYWVEGELLRNDIRQGQKGINLYLDLQVIDVSSCKPMPYVYLDLWHANSTGVYSGVSATGNGASDDDGTNLNATFLRGIAPTDHYGIVEMTTVVPGHYTGRTNHIHVMAHHNGVVAKNHTYINSTISHVGQMFFDQSLLNAVEKAKPYSGNTQDVTKNKDDSIFDSAADGYDPMLNYVYLGSDIEDGLFAWTTIGINGSASYDPSPAAYWTADGGVASNNNDILGPGGESNGTIPTGSIPTGSMPTGLIASGATASSSSAKTRTISNG